LDNAWVKNSRPFISFFSLACFRAFSDAAHSPFWCRDPKPCLRGSLKMALSQISQIYTSAYFTRESLSIWTVLRLDILSHVNFPFSRVFWHVKRGGKLAFRCGNPKLCLPRFLIKDASFSRPQNLHKCISLVEVYRFGQCLGERFSPLSTFFSLVSSRAPKDAPHSRSSCGNPNQCLPNFLKMLLLALPQIYTSVFPL